MMGEAGIVAIPGSLARKLGGLLFWISSNFAKNRFSPWLSV
jgi:hypothetical protein